MCRLAAYIGSEISLGDLLLKPDYGLMKQSWAPREMNESKLNADGYGFAWFDPENKPASYRNPMPIWSDVNLDPLSRTLFSSQWFANVRSATLGLDVNHANTQPFTNEHLVFLHNGYISDFNSVHRTKFHPLIDAEHDKEIAGSTDSEYLFALIRQTVTDFPKLSIPDVLRKVFGQVDQLLNDSRALLNIVIGDSKKIYASRHAINGQCPSLYYGVQEKLFPKGQIVISEPFNDSGNWKAIPNDHFLILDGTSQPQVIPI